MRLSWALLHTYLSINKMQALLLQLAPVSPLLLRRSEMQPDTIVSGPEKCCLLSLKRSNILGNSNNVLNPFVAV